MTTPTNEQGSGGNRERTLWVKLTSAGLAKDGNGALPPVGVVAHINRTYSTYD
jgi:hypothetical protein